MAERPEGADGTRAEPDRAADVELARELETLIAALEDLQGELEPADRERRRLPTTRDFLQFTSEVTIPAAVVVLNTNVRALKLLQRAIRTSLERPDDRTTAEPAARPARERAEAVGRRALRQLDDALGDVAAAVEGRPPDDEAAELLEEARQLQADVEARLAAGEPATDEGSASGRADAAADDGPDPNAIPVDVESELQTIKDDVAGADDGPGGGGSGDGGDPASGDANGA